MLARGVIFISFFTSRRTNQRIFSNLWVMWTSSMVINRTKDFSLQVLSGKRRSNTYQSSRRIFRHKLSLICNCLRHCRRSCQGYFLLNKYLLLLTIIWIMKIIILFNNRVFWPTTSRHEYKNFSIKSYNNKENYTKRNN